ncbi:MAG TPA: hypothetical protein VHR39_02840 [Propionibacteriaceae bacterium]|jgi:hypothetical protein|nr:hypothetical protein [Propionibacteriaceae bacterium]
MTSTTSQAGYPVRLTGELDPNLSRWLWLVKMFLAIPHYVVLAFLWVAFLVTTVIAGFAILFTGRIYVALMRDEYPPFRLDQGEYEPDDLEPDRSDTTRAWSVRRPEAWP